MFGQWMGDNKIKLKEEKPEPFEIVLPGLYNTPSKPKSEEINNYSVWIPSIECEEESSNMYKWKMVYIWNSQYN